MIRKIRISNYKSITELVLNLGRLTVLIGANGSGKSNILEGIALASAASQDKLDNEFLISRGIRVTETRFMRSAFNDVPKRHGLRISLEEDGAIEEIRLPNTSINISVQGDNGVAFDCELYAEETVSYPKWRQISPINIKEFRESLEASEIEPETEITLDLVNRLVTEIGERQRKRPAGNLPAFLVYSPEFSALRTFQSEGQILPLGIRGEGLFSHLKALKSENRKQLLEKVKENLTLIDWFENFDITEDLGPSERTIRIRDRYLAENTLFDQRSANEGFLFLLFYVTLLISPDAPAFFSIDNIDSSLNPKLCVALVQRIATLAKEHDKQVILTTHNPAVLDGLDLDDEEQRLLVVERNKVGHSRVRAVDPPRVSSDEEPVSLSEAFMRGYIGGLPKNF